MQFVTASWAPEHSSVDVPPPPPSPLLAAEEGALAAAAAAAPWLSGQIRIPEESLKGRI